MREFSVDSFNGVINPRDSSRFFTLVCSLNFLLAVVGYPLAMALLSPFGAGIDMSDGGNAFFTYPYRVFQISVALLAFWSVRNRPFPRGTWKMGLIVLFWILYFIRAFWDLVVDPPYNSYFTPGSEWYFACYVLIDCIPLLAVLKGWDCIDFQRILRWLLLLGGVGLLFTLHNMQSQVAESWSGKIGRFAATKMLHTQALGNFGCYMAIVACWALFNYRKMFWKALSVVVGLLAIYMMLKAGSRGPAFGFAAVVCIWGAIRGKNIILPIFIGVMALLLCVLFQEEILNLVGEVSSTMEARMRATLEEGDTSGRTELWASCWAEVLENPIFGFRLDRLGYAHSMILDGFMMFGLIAGGLVTVLICLGCVGIVNALRARVPNSWWLLLLLMLFTQSFTGGQFSSVALQAPLLLLFILEAQTKKAFIVK